MAEDRTFAELRPIASEFIRNGFRVFFKWTCPKCGQRCASTEANTFNVGGFIHEECGTLYEGPLFGLLAISGEEEVWP